MKLLPIHPAKIEHRERESEPFRYFDGDLERRLPGYSGPTDADDPRSLTEDQPGFPPALIPPPAPDPAGSPHRPRPSLCTLLVSTASE